MSTFTITGDIGLEELATAIRLGCPGKKVESRGALSIFVSKKPVACCVENEVRLSFEDLLLTVK